MYTSVIIVNYNTGVLLKQVVDSVIKQENAKEIIVVDNNSYDDSMAMLNENQRLTKYYNKQNNGFAWGCNYGASKASYKNLLFLNPDCILPKMGLSGLLENLRNQKVAMVGCMILNPDGSEQRASRRRLPTIWRAIKTYSRIENLARFCGCFAGVNLNHKTKPIKAEVVEAVSGACMLISKKAFVGVGGFDEEFPMHFEDLDLMKRLNNANHQIVFTPHVIAIHHQGTSSKHNSGVPQMKKKGLVRYFGKHHSKLANVIIKLLTKVY